MSLILTLDNSGNPHRWATWQDAVTYKAKDLVAWSTGEVEFTFFGGKSRMTGETSSITVPSIMAIKNKHHAKHRPPVLTNRNLFRRDLFICAYCGHSHNEAKLTRDHVVPVSKGGKDTWMNVVTACWKCNNYKDDSLLDDLNMALLYVPYVPSRVENLILQNRKILVDQMEFLKAYIPENSRAHQLLK
jgi:5-methylcytosine-specific restriction endonuclease McrA